MSAPPTPVDVVDLTYPPPPTPTRTRPPSVPRPRRGSSARTHSDTFFPTPLSIPRVEQENVPPPQQQRGRSSSISSNYSRSRPGSRTYVSGLSQSGPPPPVPPSLLRNPSSSYSSKTRPHSPPLSTISQTPPAPLPRRMSSASNHSHSHVRRVPVPSNPATVITVPANHNVTTTTGGNLHRTSSAHSSRPPVSGVAYADRPRRVSDASTRQRPRTTSTSRSRPTTPTHHNGHTEYTTSNVRVRQRTPSSRSTEQVMYVPSGQPIVIIDERRNKNTPLPTVIRDGKVVMGGDGRSRSSIPANATRTIVRSDPGDSPGQQHTQAHNQRSRSASQSRFVEGNGNGASNSRDIAYADVPAPLTRRRTWGHKNKRAPPFGHHDMRCHSSWHGLRDWWMGVLMRNPSRRALGNASYEDAHRERDLERRKRQAEFERNLKLWRSGRRDVSLW